MKKLFIGILCLTALSQTLSANEVLTKSTGEEIIFTNYGTWMPKEKFDRINSFNEKVDIEITQINKKNNEYRTLTFKITNNTRDEDLKYVAFGVKFRFGEEYSLRKIISVNNLKAGESIEVQRQISVQDIEGRDVITKVIDFSF